MMMPFNHPAKVPVASAARNANHTHPVDSYVNMKAIIPIAIMEGNERSISPAITVIVNGIAMMAKNGMVDIKA
jgi:hypothetical protein